MRPFSSHLGKIGFRRPTLSTVTSLSPRHRVDHRATASLSTCPAPYPYLSSTSSSSSASPPPPYLRPVPGGVSVYVQCKAGCHVSSVASVSAATGLCVRIGAAAVEGAANAELVRFLASVLGVPKGSVSISKGASSSRKLVAVRTEQKWQQVQAALSSRVSE